MNGIGDKLAGKLERAGLIQRRSVAVLGKFLDAYIDRKARKPRTRTNYTLGRTYLVKFFGEDKLLREITSGDADRWKDWMHAENYANGTIGRAVGWAKQFFGDAVRCRLVESNPFAEVKAPSQVNRTRDFSSLAKW